MDKQLGKEKLVIIKNIITSVLVIVFFVGIVGTYFNIHDLGSKFSFRLKQKIVDEKPLGDYEKSKGCRL